MTYLISIERFNQSEQVRIRAASIEQAAYRHAKRAHKATTAQRVTGFPSMSGVFQAYRPIKTGGLTSVGPAFHVREDS